MAIREISRRGLDARNANEVRRGSDGDRTDVQGSAAEGHSLAGAKLTLAGARGHARIPFARKNRHGAPGQNSLASRRARAWGLLEGNGGADQNRSLVPPDSAGN